MHVEAVLEPFQWDIQRLRWKRVALVLECQWHPIHSLDGAMDVCALVKESKEEKRLPISTVHCNLDIVKPVYLPRVLAKQGIYHSLHQSDCFILTLERYIQGCDSSCIACSMCSEPVPDVLCTMTSLQAITLGALTLVVVKLVVIQSNLVEKCRHFLLG
jgi:hypothetical protein